MNDRYSASFPEKADFDRIREMLLDLCYSSLGQKQVDRIRFETCKDRIVCLVSQAEEFRQIILSGKQFPGSHYYDLTEVLTHLRPAGTYATADILLDLKLSVETMTGVTGFLSRRGDDGDPEYPYLARLIDGVEIDPGLPRQIDSLVDENGLVRSSASPELKSIRDEKQQLEKKALHRINSILNEAKAEGWIAQDTELTLRNGRQVIPLGVANKRRLRGFVHDYSATGQTAYLEPEEVFELNNRIRELEGEERQEVIRLLKAFADVLRPMLDDLEKGYEMLGHVDATRAKARLALEMDASMPHISDEPRLAWVNARHPLLYLSYKKQQKQVVPMTLELNDKNRILIISGPNAGGKSVCLKTCGLIQYMLQCGLLVPVDSYSGAGIFHHLFIDIGDEQSLENDLSTYSSHLLNMKTLLEQAHQRTLFLIDEFGAGTEPRIGGAIAEAILEQLHEKKAMGVVTTHYANLKLMAGKYPGMLNGSMLFDSKRMKPLFKLKTGNPGSSFAFEIARSIGLPDPIIAKAGALAGDQDLDFDVQLQDLEVKKSELETKDIELRRTGDFLSELIDKYEQLRDELHNRKNEILMEARKEAKEILSGANKMIENTIREIREAQAGREKTREARKKLSEFSTSMNEQLDQMPQADPGEKKARKKKRKLKQPDDDIDPTPVKTGDIVRVKGQETPGEVAQITGSVALVLFGSIQLRIAVDELEKTRKKSIRTTGTRSSSSSVPFDIHARAAAFRPDIDLRSDRVDEALQKVQTHIDDAYLLGVPQIRILHGKGDGVLRPAIRSFLKEIPHVRRFRDEHPDRGGAGITVVDFGK